MGLWRHLSYYLQVDLLLVCL
ncbi:hypothetical protein ZEAMMB73_Zm00001d020582 [Zea mays]|uniref:Uncharacterized protein n=1 Tax=Zea mays TaxID=4577 RepID=A0A1D6I4T9_MAIZE|nr:hypothetical protein ZEAMMB73_Zm00001d020582 [Zea mays]